MSLSSGDRLGPYEIRSALGAGGMGEVFRARDTILNRDVAIKVLPDVFANDAERLARFIREAQALAALNHPNIAHIHGLEESGSVRALVMELVEGEDLSDHIRRGPMAVADAVGIARQIADALEVAHEQGIIHRDLKPANIMVRPDGTVKILDFGLAKALIPAADERGAVNAANSPTMTAQATQMGVILGTAAYMSPEQAKGRPVDRRADIWAFGVVLFEMLTARRAFDGEDISTTLAAVLMKDPEWTALPDSTPGALRRLIRRCLVRDPRHRLRDIGEARILLNDVEALREPAAGSAAAQPRPRARLVPWLLAGLAGVAAAIAIAFNVLRVTPAAQPVRFTVPPPPNVRPLSNGSDYHGGAISPDGLHVVFSGADARTGRVAIYHRRIDSVEATLIKGTDGGRYPFWSPNSRSIAFYAQGKLNRVDIDGGSPLVICDAPTGGWGGAWSTDDVILAGVTDPGPIFKVSAKGGGTPTPVTKLDPVETDHDWPQFLPDGRHFVYTAWTGFLAENNLLLVGSLDSPDRKVISKGAVHPGAYADPDFILFIRGDTLLAQRIDLTTFDLRGDPEAIASHAWGPITPSRTGAVSYMMAPPLSSNRVAWVNRDGTDERAILESGFYADPAVSPDGSRLAYARKESTGGTFDVWIRDLVTGADRRLTFDPADDRSPVWSPSGDEIVFRGFRQPPGLYRKRADGSGEETPIAPKAIAQSAPYQWHPGGFITAYGDVGASLDVWRIPLPDFNAAAPLIRTSAVNEARGAVSPDGRWLAYDARETARFEVFLTTYPPSASKWAVTTEGGAEPKWSKDGRELFYVSSATGALMSVAVTPGAPPTFGAHRQVHPGPLDWGWNSSHSFDLDPRTGRVVVEILNAAGELTLLLNWQSLLSPRP